jgi:hypothetical protein
MFYDSSELIKMGEFGFRPFQFIDISKGAIFALPPTKEAKKSISNRLLPLVPGNLAKDALDIIVGFVAPTAS